MTDDFQEPRRVPVVTVRCPHCGRKHHRHEGDKSPLRCTPSCRFKEWLGLGSAQKPAQQRTSAQRNPGMCPKCGAEGELNAGLDWWKRVRCQRCGSVSSVTEYVVALREKRRPTRGILETLVDGLFGIKKWYCRKCGAAVYANPEDFRKNDRMCGDCNPPKSHEIRISWR